MYILYASYRYVVTITYMVHGHIRHIIRVSQSFGPPRVAVVVALCCGGALSVFCRACSSDPCLLALALVLSSARSALASLDGYRRHYARHMLSSTVSAAAAEQPIVRDEQHCRRTRARATRQGDRFRLSRG